MWCALAITFFITSWILFFIARSSCELVERLIEEKENIVESHNVTKIDGGVRISGTTTLNIIQEPAKDDIIQKSQNGYNSVDIGRPVGIQQMPQWMHIALLMGNVNNKR